MEDTKRSGKTSALLVLLQKSQYQGGSWLLTREWVDPSADIRTSVRAKTQMTRQENEKSDTERPQCTRSFHVVKSLDSNEIEGGISWKTIKGFLELFMEASFQACRTLKALSWKFRWQLRFWSLGGNKAFLLLWSAARQFSSTLFQALERDAVERSYCSLLTPSWVLQHEDG